MTKRLTIKEAIEYFNLSEKTIRRRIRSGKFDAEKQGNQWFVMVNSDPSNGHKDQTQGHTDHQNSQSDPDNGQPDQPLIDQLQSENQYLREQVDHLTHIVAMSQKNIATLTDQLDASRVMIEDMRKRPSGWRRLFRWT